MKNINIIVENKRATVVGSPVIICGNSDYTVTFTFDAEWTQSGARTARFVYVKGGEVRHEDVVFTGNTVAVPVLSDVTFVNVGVFEGDLCTTTPARVNCHPSILCGSGKIPDPTPDVYSQIMALFNELAAKGVGGATEEQAQQIRQNKEDIEALADGTKTAGDASKLEGHAASYFATAQSVTNLINGTTPAGNASKLGGHGAEYFASTADLANYLPLVSGTTKELKTNSSSTLSVNNTSGTNNYIQYKGTSGGLGYLGFSEANVPSAMTTGGVTWNLLHSGNYFDYALPLTGGKISKDSVLPLTIENTVSNIDLLGFRGASGSLGHLGFSGVNTPTFLSADASTYYPLLHSGNYSEYALPKNGGGTVSGLVTIERPTVNPLIVHNSSASAVMSLVQFNGNGVTYGSLGFSGTDNPVYIPSSGYGKVLHHDGNSAKVHIGTSAPSDTSALWIDTSA